MLFQTVLLVIQENTNLNSQSLASGPRLACMDYIYFGVGNFNFIQGYIIYKISLFLTRFGSKCHCVISQMSFVKGGTNEGVYKLSEQLDTLPTAASTSCKKRTRAQTPTTRVFSGT